MNIYVTVKAAGKRKSYIDNREIPLTEPPATLKELLTAIIIHQVRVHEAKETDAALLPYLTSEEIEQQGSMGKVGFGAKYNSRTTDLTEAISVGLLAFEDGLFRVFIREQEAERLEDPIVLQDGDDVALIKFTMLAGRMW